MKPPREYTEAEKDTRIRELALAAELEMIRDEFVKMIKIIDKSIERLIER